MKLLQKYFVYFVLPQLIALTMCALKNDYQAVSTNGNHFSCVLIKYVGYLMSVFTQ